MHEIELVEQEKVSDQDLHNTFELLDRHPVNVADLHYFRDDFVIKC